MKEHEVAPQSPVVRLLSIEEVQAITGLSKSTIQKGTGEDWFPPGRKFGRRSVRWLSSYIDTWIATLPEVRYAAPGAHVALSKERVMRKEKARQPGSEAGLVIGHEQAPGRWG